MQKDEQSCLNCRYGKTLTEPGETVYTSITASGELGGGRVAECGVVSCRYDPPKLRAGTSERWPRVSGDEWCRMFEPNE